MIPLPRAASIDTIVYLAEGNKKNLETNIIPMAIADAARVFDISEDQLTSSSRDRQLVYIRVILFYTLRYQYKRTSTGIAKAFGKDHTTILHACNMAQELSDTEDAWLLATFDRLRKEGSLSYCLPEKKRVRPVFAEKLPEVYDRKATYSNHSPMQIATPRTN